MNPNIRKWIALISLGVFLGLVYLIHDVLLPFVLSGIFIYLLAPVVDFLSRQTILGRPTPRGLSVILVYIFLLIITGLLGIIVLPPLYQEVLKIANDFPNHLEYMRTVILPNLIALMEEYNTRFALNLNIDEMINQSINNLIKAGQTQIESIATYTQTLVKLLFSALSTFLVIFIVTAFVLVDLPRIKKGMHELVPPKFRHSVLALIHAIDKDLSGAIRGQLVICLINGTLTTLGLLLLQVKFAITIGFIAGVFSLIPVFGAVISTIPAVIIALTQSWMTAVAVIIVIIIIHLIEANFLNPKVLGHTVELHPAIIIFAIVVGEHFFGPIGLLFGVPVAAIVRSVLRYSYQQIFMGITPEAEHNDSETSETPSHPPNQENLIVEQEPSA